MNYDEMQQLSLLIKDFATFKNHAAYLWRFQPLKWLFYFSGYFLKALSFSAKINLLNHW